MGYLTWALRIFLLLVFFLFAQKNFEMTSLRFYFDLEWRAPLILMLLVFFVLGVILTLLALLPRLLRQRREPAATPGRQAAAAVEPPQPPRDGVP